jgi:hypothetical protein
MTPITAGSEAVFQVFRPVLAFSLHGRARSCLPSFSNEISARLRDGAIELNRTLRDMMWLVRISLKFIRCTLCTIYVILHSRVTLRLCGFAASGRDAEVVSKCQSRVAMVTCQILPKLDTRR